MNLHEMEDYDTWYENMTEECGALTLGERLMLSKQFEPTDENIKALGIDEETAKASLYIMRELNNQKHLEIMEDTLDENPWDDEDLKIRVMGFPAFIQALYDVVLAMQTGKIKTTEARAKKRLPFFFRQMCNPSNFGFQCAINEMGNIARGKADL